tara:strand:+ start:610 stop:756 length:147 start_codon:yes stop_codon:yes gene_type:complete
MGCGCKKNRKKKSVEGESTSKLFKEQKEYRSRVNQAIKQLADIKKRKR